MNGFRKPFQIIRADLRAYVLVTALVYGMLVLGMALGMIFPDLHAARTSSFAGGDQGALAGAALTLIPHSLTLLIEFQAYVLVLLGVYLLGRSWLRPTSVGAATRRQAYVRGLNRLGWLWLPALALFVLGAVYEVVEIYFLVPLMLST